MYVACSHWHFRGDCNCSYRALYVLLSWHLFSLLFLCCFMSKKLIWYDMIKTLLSRQHHIFCVFYELICVVKFNFRYHRLQVLFIIDIEGLYITDIVAFGTVLGIPCPLVGALCPALLYVVPSHRVACVMKRKCRYWSSPSRSREHARLRAVDRMPQSFCWVYAPLA